MQAFLTEQAPLFADLSHIRIWILGLAAALGGIQASAGFLRSGVNAWEWGTADEGTQLISNGSALILLGFGREISSTCL